MKIKKDGSVIFNSIDNTGSTDEASLGARYAKGRLDSTDNNLHQNYYTKEEVQELISGMGRTKIIPTLFEDWYIYVPEEEATEEEIYYHVNNSTIVSEPSLDDLPTYYRQWKIEDGEVVPVLWFISCAKDTEIVEGQAYYSITLFGPTTKSTAMKNYVKAKIQVESNTYYFVGNDDDGYTLYYYDADFKEAIIGDFEIDFSQYAVKETTIGSYTLENDITAQNIQDDIKDLTAELTNKTIDADNNTIENIIVSNFKTGVVKTAMPETPADTELLSAKAIDEAKQDKLTAGTAITTVEDATTVSQIDLTNKKSSPISALNVWNYIKGKFTVSTISTVEDTTTIADVNTSNANPVSRFTAATLWTYILTKLTTTISSASTNQQAPSNKAVYDYVEARRRYLHILVRYNNTSFQYPMGWCAVITDNKTETYETIAKWLYDNQYRSPENSYYWVGGCCGTTGVRNSADTGTSYVGRVTSGAFSEDGTSIAYKFDYNGTVSVLTERCVIESYPLMKLTT